MLALDAVLENHMIECYSGIEIIIYLTNNLHTWIVIVEDGFTGTREHHAMFVRVVVETQAERLCDQCSVFQTYL